MKQGTQQQDSDPEESSLLGLAGWQALLLCVWREHGMRTGLENVDETDEWFDVGENQKTKLALRRCLVGLASRWGWSRR